MTETSPYAGPDDVAAPSAQPPAATTPELKSEILQPVPPEAGDVITATPPSGDTTIIGKCCPPAVEFYGAVVSTNLKYFGYDPLNNRTLPEGDSKVYWSKNTRLNHVDIEYGSLSKPPTRTEIDGSAWFSVGVGETTRFAAEFLGSGCFQNVVFESEDPSIAVSVDGTGKATKQEMVVKGVGPGETTIFARCEGKLIGWVHIWVTHVATITLDVGYIQTPQTVAAPYSLADLQAYLNLVFGQARIKFAINDVGAINMPALTLANPLNPGAELQAAESAIQVAAAGKLFSKYHLLFFIPSSSVGFAQWGGEVPGGVGTGMFGYVFQYLNDRAAYQAAAHEIGHMLNLSHPEQDTDADEFTHDQWNNVGISAGNVIEHNTYNLMGYGHSYVYDYELVNILGYMQWNKVRRY